jgi:protein TonB
MQPVRIGGGVKAPVRLDSLMPAYPELARRVGATGIVIMECIIDTGGRVTNVRVLRGHPLLDAAAVDAVYQWRYQPGTLNGIAVPVIMTVTVNYKMPR